MPTKSIGRQFLPFALQLAFATFPSRCDLLVKTLVSIYHSFPYCFNYFATHETGEGNCSAEKLLHTGVEKKAWQIA